MRALIDNNGSFHESAPPRYEGGGVAGAVDEAWLIANAGWRLATAEEIAAHAQSQTEANAAAEAEKFANIASQATLFRAVLRQHFGEGAETNRAVTAKAVEQYFIAKQLSGTITASDLGAATILERGFEALKAYTGDGTSWSFPWENLPEVNQ